MKRPHASRSKCFTIILTGVLLFASLFSRPLPIHAADFEIQIDRTFTVSDTGTRIHITETRTIKSNSNSYFIPAGSTETFTIQNFKEGFDEAERALKEQSISVKNNRGATVTTTVSIENEDIIVTVTYPSPVTYGRSLTYTLEYDTDELSERVGSITNIYIPGLDTSYQELTTDPETNTATQVQYNTSLVVPTSLGNASFTLPTPTSQSESTSQREYSFSTDALLGTTVWHQIGTEQTYFFRMTQHVPRSDRSTPDALSFLSKSRYDLMLPRDYSETNQSVYFTKIEPAPDSITIDDDGNTTAAFFLDATKDIDIVAEGYITVSVEGASQDQSEASAATIDQIDLNGSMSTYLQSAEYWESDAPEIVAKAMELSTGKTNILEILKADYDFIVQSIDYDDFKYGDRNTRRGALATLKGGSSVCMEYSDLLIAIARAQGIPARAAYGYGYDPKLLPDEQEEHQWVQAWIPDYGWLTIDPTWGETGRQFIGKDLDHALWYVASTNPNIPSPLQVTAADINITLEDSIIEITAVDGMSQAVTPRTINDIVTGIETEDGPASDVIHMIQTSMLGRSLVIILPVVGLLIILSIIGKVIELILKSIRKRKPDAPPPPAYPESPARVLPTPTTL